MSILVDVCANLLKKRTYKRSFSEGDPTSDAAVLYLELGDTFVYEDKQSRRLNAIRGYPVKQLLRVISDS